MTSAPIQFDLWMKKYIPIAEQFQRTLIAVINDGIGSTARAVDIQRVFGVGYTTAHRLHRAAFAETPRDIALALPGRSTILRIIERAEHICESKALVKQLRVTYEQFFEQVEQIASTQQELTAILSAHDPEILRETAVRQRANFFRAAIDLAGGYMECDSAVWIVRPNEIDPSFGDLANVSGTLGLRRLGVMQPVTRSTFNGTCSNYKLLNGQPIDPEKNGSLVQDLSSKKLPSMRFISANNNTHATYFSEDLPQGVPVDIVNESIMERAMVNIQPNGYGTDFISNILNRPTKVFIGDYLIHQDMWPGIDPQLKIYDLQIPDEAYPEDYWFREIPCFEELELLSTHRAMLPSIEAPKHIELLQYAIDQMKLNMENYRIYRIVIRYPVVNHHMRVFFSRKPEEEQTK